MALLQYLWRFAQIRAQNCFCYCCQPKNCSETIPKTILCPYLCKSSWILKQWWRNYRKYESTFSSSECNLPCLMTSDKNYLGDGNIDKFDALFFKIRHFGPRKQGILFLLCQSIVPKFWFIWLCYLSFIGK